MSASDFRSANRTDVFQLIERPPPPNATVHPPGPLQRRGVARNQIAAPVALQRLVRRSFVVGEGAFVPLQLAFDAATISLAVVLALLVF
jgi:hypothetical protein